MQLFIPQYFDHYSYFLHAECSYLFSNCLMQADNVHFHCVLPQRVMLLLRLHYEDIYANVIMKMHHPSPHYSPSRPSGTSEPQSSPVCAVLPP